MSEPFVPEPKDKGGDHPVWTRPSPPLPVDVPQQRFRVTTVQRDGVERDDSRHANARDAFRRQEQIRRRYSTASMVVLVRDDDDSEHDPDIDDYCPRCGAYWPPTADTHPCGECGLAVDDAAIDWQKHLYDELPEHDLDAVATVRHPGVVVQLPTAESADLLRMRTTMKLRKHLVERGWELAAVEKEVSIYNAHAAGGFGRCLGVTQLWVEVQ